MLIVAGEWTGVTLNSEVFYFHSDQPSWFTNSTDSNICLKKFDILRIWTIAFQNLNASGLIRRRNNENIVKVLDYSDEKAQWRETGPMPTYLRGLRGTKLDGVFYVTGDVAEGTNKLASLEAILVENYDWPTDMGWSVELLAYLKRNLLETSGGFDEDTRSASDSVLAWDPVAEIWTLAGHLAEPRS